MQANDIISSGLLELYATGLASKEEASQVAQWIVEYPEVAEELAAIQVGLETYAQGNAITPDSSIKDKIFSRINTKSEVKVVSLPTANKSTTAKVHTIPSNWKRVAAASAILLFASIAINITLYNKYDQTSRSLVASQKEMVSLKDTNDVLQNSNNIMNNDMSVVQSKYAKPVVLDGMAAAPEAAAKIFWMKNTGDVYVDPSNLPEVPEGKQFQLWAIVDGKPVDAGMIITSKKGTKYHIQKMKSFGKAEAFAITIEKDGGSPTPTMDQMVVMGKL